MLRTTMGEKNNEDSLLSKNGLRGSPEKHFFDTCVGYALRHHGTPMFSISTYRP